MPSTRRPFARPSDGKPRVLAHPLDRRPQGPRWGTWVASSAPQTGEAARQAGRRASPSGGSGLAAPGRFPRRTATRRWLGPVARLRHPRPSGQGLVEFALVLPVLLVLLAGALDLGRVFYANITLGGAAREGALQAARTPGSFVADAPCDTTTNMVVCRVQLEAKGSMVEVAPEDIDLVCSTSGCPAQGGSTVTVTVHGTFRLLTPLLAAVFGGQTLPLTSSATAQIEFLPPATTATAPPGPVADFTATPRTGNSPLAVRFTDTSFGDPTQWQWDFGDGATSIEQHPVHEYAAPGTYTVSLTAINVTNADVETKAGYIVVTVDGSPGPMPSPTPVPTPACAYPPNVIGESPASAQADLTNAGFAPLMFADLTTGTKGRIQAQNPDHTQCLPPGTTITLHYRPL
jgi:Flp pilus assembly protein TadG